MIEKDILKHNHAGGDYAKVNMRDLAGTMWDDLRTPLNSVKISGSKPPTWTAYMNSEVLGFSDQAVEGNEEIVYFSIQLPHGYREGSSLIPHIHWVGEDGTAGNVRWKLTYSWASAGGVFPAATTITVDAPNSTTANTHNMTNFSAISGVGQKVSSMLVCSLSRNSSNAGDTLTGKSAYLIELDFHYEIDSIGSNAISAKN